MLNSVTIIGKVLEMGADNKSLVVEVERPFREADGEYATDKFTVELWKGLYEKIEEFAVVGALLGIKGRLRSNVSQEGRCSGYSIIAEKVSCLTTTSNVAIN